MKKGGKADKKKPEPAKEEKKEEPVEEKPPEPVPVVEEKKENKNIERVLIARLEVKDIVSHHSGTILADPSPFIVLDEEHRNKALKAFQSQVDPTDNTVSKDKVVSMLVYLGHNFDTAKLQAIVTQLCPELPEKLIEDDFIGVYSRFIAPEYFYGQHLRMYASRGCILQMLQLIMRGCNINCGDGEGLTCLHHACEYNRLDVIEALLDIGKGALAVNAQDKYGWTPLHCASHHGSLQCVQKLLTCNVDLRLKNKVGKTCLHLACAQNRSVIVPLLLQKDADLINVGDDMDMTPIHEAAYRGHMALYQELAKHPKADTTAKDKLDRQPEDYIVNE